MRTISHELPCELQYLYIPIEQKLKKTKILRGRLPNTYRVSTYCQQPSKLIVGKRFKPGKSFFPHLPGKTLSPCYASYHVRAVYKTLTV